MKLVIASVFLIAAASAAVVPVEHNQHAEPNSQPSSLVGKRSAGFGEHLDRPNQPNSQQSAGFGQHLDRPNQPNQQPQHPAHFGQHNQHAEPNSQPSSLVGQRSAGFGQHLDRPVTHKTSNEYNNYEKHSTNYHNGQESRILHYESEQDPEQGYKFGYHTSHGNEEVQRSEEAQIRRIDEEHASVAVQGVVEYVNHEGKRVRWTYTADENGYHPSEITVT
ncbi:filaggrin-2-like isoform X2 [Diabrotica virgifera virgifera]|uniref:Filaggrin-2-like n=1 Tax=Diabrotica virgifera virgifera TaxID=50390 RepID=A0A6P7F9A7_DIAVI|nr:filaggrin-2-like isoform X2 [Diabrotica virgifera virgifera]